MNKNAQPAKKKPNIVKTIGRVLKFVAKEYPIFCIIVLLSLILSAVASANGTMFFKTLISNHIEPAMESGNLDKTALIKDIVRLAAIYLVAVITTFVAQRLMVNITQGTLRSIRNSLFEHMQKLPIPYFDKHQHGDIMSVYTNDTDTLRQLISQSIPNLISSTATIISSTVSMLILSPLLSLIAFIVVFFAVIITKTLGTKSARYFRKRQADIGKINGYIEEMAEGQKVIKVFNHEGKIMEDFGQINDELYESTKNANGLANIVMPIMGNLGYVNYVLVAIIGGVFAINNIGGFGIASLVPFLQFTRTFNQPISQFSQQINSIIMAIAGAERIFALLDEPVEKDEGYVTLVNAKEVDGKIVECEERTGKWAWKHPHQADGSITYTLLKGDVVFDGVDFGYDPDKIVLHDIKMYAKPGQKVAFVGATGAGKTTITNLINRFYDIQDGKIRYDGININKIKKDDLRRSLGVVLQDTHLFTGSVADNIRYGKPDATDEEVIAAAKLVNADYFISHLPQGYDTKITADGASLSQGQRQLIAIARAAVADPPVLILDEATSSIDTRTEAIVAQGMDSLMAGRTVFVIAHRLSTVKNSDVIMVLDAGRIIERGNHDDLIAQGGVYSKLYSGINK